MCRRKSNPSPRPSLAPSIRPGHVGHGVGGVPGHHHAQVGDQRGERVVRDLGAGPGDGGDQGGLAGAGEADQPDVGHHLELEGDRTGLALLAQQGETGRLAGRRGQRGVAEPASAPLGDDQFRLRAGQVGQHLAGRGVADHRAVRHAEHDVLAAAAVGMVPPAGLPVRGPAVGLPVVVDQRGQLGIDPQDHRAAVTAVAAVRAAQRLELLPVHRGAAVASVAAVHMQRDLVDKARDRHGWCTPFPGGTRRRVARMTGHPPRRVKIRPRRKPQPLGSR